MGIQGNKKGWEGGPVRYNKRGAAIHRAREPLLPDSVTNGSSPGDFPRQLCVAFANRLLLNTGKRFIYPFGPAVSRGLGVQLSEITPIIAMAQITGLSSLIFGPLADRRGYRLVMLLGMTSLTVGMFSAGLLATYRSVMFGVFMAGLAKAIFDPAIIAFAGEKVPFAKRGRTIGLLEISWAATALITLPLVGLLIDRFGWRSPFWAIGGLAAVGMAALYAVFPVTLAASRDGGVARHADFQRFTERPVAGALVFAFCLNAASDNIFVVYGAWMEANYGLSVTALGLATTVIGGAELCGEGLAATFADRVGLKRSVIGGIVLSGFGYGMLPYISVDLGKALISLFLIFVTVEFSIVVTISLFTELAPGSRATLMAGYLAAASLGRVAGAMSGGLLWGFGGIQTVALSSAGVTAVGAAVLVWGIRDWLPAIPPSRPSVAPTNGP